MSTSRLGGYLNRGAREIVASDQICLGCAKEAEDLARYTASHLDERQQIVAELPSTAWDTFGDLWNHLALSLHPTITPEFGFASEDSRRDLALGLAKLERNLVAGLADHQALAIAHEAAVRQLIFNITTFARIEDPTFFTLQTIMTQLLVNLISPVSPDPTPSTDEILQVYMSGKREDDVVIRLLDSQNVKTNQATLHLILNLTRNSPERQSMSLAEPGIRWFGRLLSRIDEWHEKEDGRFELAVEIFTQFIREGKHPRLYTSLGDSSEPITPSQTSFLKLIDSYLSDPDHPNDSPSPHIFLVNLFKDYSRYALISIGSGQDDARLPKVFEGMVLVCEGLVSMGLASQGRKDRRESQGGDEEVVQAVKEEGIKPLVDLLGALNRLIPRVKPGSKTLPPDQAAPVTLLKRLLVQLLGILTFEDTTTGDRVRECGGVELVLGLTEVDESNPYLREHALLTIRNLMLNNPANQAIITQMDPVGVISEEGEVLPLPEKMRKK